MKFRTTAKQIAAGIIAAAMLIGTLAGCSGNSTKQSSASSKAETSTASVKRGESHDPSIVKANGKYYIFGSHRAWLKSDDLINWSTFTNNLSTDYEKIFKDIWDGWAKQSSNPDVKGNMWAPDVIWNETMGKWCMYMSINGANYRSVIVLLTADDIEAIGRTLAGVYSGFERVNVKRRRAAGAWRGCRHHPLHLADRHRHQRHRPVRETDDNGDMWMTFGSWFGGMWMFKLDSATGLRDYNSTYPTEANKSDAYYGVKLGGRFGNSGEAPTCCTTTATGIYSPPTARCSRPVATRSACSAPRTSPARTLTKPATPRFPPSHRQQLAKRHRRAPDELDPVERQRQREHRGLPGPQFRVR